LVNALCVETISFANERLKAGGFMTTLYYAPGACSLAPHIVLEWIGAPYEAVKVQFGSKELLAINPAGAVPTLREDDGWLLTQAGAVLSYLVHKHPEAHLGGGQSLREQADVSRWSAFLPVIFMPHFGLFLLPSVIQRIIVTMPFRPSLKQLKVWLKSN